MSNTAHSMKTDAEIIKEYQNGRLAAFDELAKRYLPDMYNFFYASVQHTEDAEDLTQTALFNLYKGISKFQFRSEFKTYLYRINTNVVRNYYRKKKIRSIFTFEEPKEYEGIVEEDQDPIIEKEELWKHIGSLPYKQKMVLIMRLSQQLPFRSIGDILDISEGSAKVNYHYGLKTLKNALKGAA